MHSLFRWLFTREAPDALLQQQVATLARQLVALGGRLDTLTDELELQRAAFHAFRGRVYAWKRYDGVVEPQEKAVAPTSLADPAMPKAEVRKRLSAAGLLKPHDPLKTN